MRRCERAFFRWPALLLLIFHLLAPAARAATTRAAGDFILTYWETDDGLPENSATCMVQTRDGYLWFGTYNGLVRFDGVRFIVFDPGNTPELPNPGIVNLYLTRNGQLLCSTLKGMARLANGRWTRFGREQGWTSNYARTFVEGRDGTVYVTAFDGGVFKFNGERFETMPSPPGDSENGYFGHMDGDGQFWVAQHRFIGYWDGKVWQRVVPPMDQEDFGACSARDHELWVVQNDVIRKINRQGVTREFKLREPIQGFWSMVEAGSGDLWICSFSDGVYQVSTNGAMVHYTVNSGLPHDAVRFVFEDRERNYWVGTSGGGLMRVKQRTFRTYGTESGLAERVVKSVFARSNGEVLAGTHGKGSALFNLRGAAPHASFLTPHQPAFVQSVLEDSSGEVWLGSMDEGLHRLTPTGAVRFPEKDNSVRSVAALFEDSQRRLWAGFTDDVMIREGATLTPVRTSEGRRIRGVRGFAQEPLGGAVFAASEEGVFRLAGDAFHEIRDQKGAAIEQVFCLKPLSDGTIWLGTANHGLLRYRNGVVTPVDEAQGLPVRTVGSIIEDDSGHWWIGSNRGILRVDPARLEAAANGDTNEFEPHLFTTSDGLASIECATGFQPSAARGGDGHLWFATVKGVAEVDPAGVHINKRPPPVVIESARWMDAKRQSHEVDAVRAGTITLPAGSSQLEVKFTALSFTAPEKMRFAYELLQGNQPVASEEVTGRTLGLNLLPAGTYRLHVTASNNDGVWNEEGATLGIIISPFFWQTLWFRGTAFAAAGLVLGGIFWRTSERRVRIQREKFEQQKALAEEKARLASVLEGTSDLVGFAQPDGKILYINPAGRRMLGLDPAADVSQLDIRDFYDAEANEVLRETALPAAIREGTWSGEAVMRPRGKDEILTSQVLLAHKNRSGQVLFVSAIVRDITESRKMEEQLRHSQKMEALGTLASGIAHDFNNVLSAIIGNIELARVDVGPSHLAVESLNEVRKASIRARDLVQQILAFGRQQVQDRKVVSLSSVVSEAAKLLRATLPAGIDLVTTIAPGTPNVIADASQMHQVLLNLGTNAWHALDNAPGRIEIGLDRVESGAIPAGADLPAGPYVRLTVSDTGRGMDSSTLEHIFEPFFTTKTRGRGTGLGLAVVHGIVKNHQGAITVSSQPGKGTTFQLFLPATGEPAETPLVEADRPMAPNGRGERILYLDDEAPLVFLASRALERIGYRVTGFTTPNEALTAFQKDPHQFDVVVTDFNMPGMSGLEVAHIFLSLRPDIPVLLTSGYLSDELRTNARAAGVSALIYKPNTISELREAIHRWVGENQLAASDK